MLAQFSRLGFGAALLVACLALGGCAIGRKADYSHAGPITSLSSQDKVAVTVHDARPYVVNGQKNPTYVGVQRAMLGNPWNINTLSGQPLAHDLTLAVQEGLKNNAIAVVPVFVSFRESHSDVKAKLLATGARRMLLLTLWDFYSDTYANTGFTFKAKLEVFDAKGALLAASSTTSTPNGTVTNLQVATRQYLSQLLNAPQVLEAMK